ncbi:transglutaminase domain-containing protein [Aeromonas rivipollensis]|uniref:Transglutaminase domain-containing protein n=1 Tax=Aeromonas rivipollensis TaxID=948519 RepID=A0ABX0D3U1_9GAMM|nr:transglutaminase domain-containing protein [Aeromonas rivipollensis]NEX90871.1 transglutaminase domain-containing protein [Aeromonas rivipollensis]NEY06096.1 transglutaminase domain-containing protein [Aeromonas rivipollensis]
MKTTRSLSLLLGMLLALPASAGQTYFNSNGGQLNVGWQDREGQPQQLSYRLEAGKLPPLIAYRPARMQEEVLQTLLQQAALEFPEVQFSLARPSLALSLKSRNADKAREASLWVKPEQARLEAEWLKQHYFQPFTPPDGTPAIKQDHVRIALESRAELAPLAEQLKQEGATETEARQKTVAHMLDFIQTIPYQLLDSQSGRSGKGFLSPRQVLEQNRGDCDSKVTLMAALLAQRFPELKQAMVFVPGHALLGVALPASPGQATLSWQGESYLLLEPTGPAQLPMGQLAPTSKTLVDSKQLSIQPVLASN